MSDLIQRSPLVRLLALLIGLHSCCLGLLMLLAPGTMLKLLGFSPGIPVFFPSQSGIFLLILGGCYLWALVDPAFLWVILASKAAAVAFLVVHAVFFAAPPMIWAAAAGDGGMFTVLAAVMFREHRKAQDSPGI